ncbi:PREDICTED: uncharacterized protein LOC18594299 [Theobroma cacao]|uniref:Uncharacterized protein LOC18594299 n=1 Tax=Theobroma cacao TaxID=3641 RepID=A0AB32WK78_THECC|nr:PREDICTED: uncharacterized protein LOC18594299 [Theobroma cacao]
METIRIRLGMDGCLAVDANDRSGGLAMVWRKTADVTVTSYSRYHIDTEIMLRGSKWRFIGFYGHPKANERHQSWSLLRQLESRSQLSWLCIGDFNEILFANKRKAELTGGKYKRRRFERHVLIVLYGIWVLLDQSILGGIIENLKSSFIVDWIGLYVRKGGKRFFQELQFLMNLLEVLIIWRKDWIYSTFERYVGVEGFILRRHGYWMKSLQVKIWKKKEEIQEMHLTGINLQNLKQSQAELNDLNREEEVMWRQRSRIEWLRDGDKNTKFFHQRAKERRRKNTVWALKKKDDAWRESQEELLQEASNFFSHLFTSSNPTMEDAELLSTIKPKVTSEMNGQLNEEITKEESAFVQGWQLADNVIVAQEIIHSLHNKRLGKVGNFALKLDMSKVYDRVEWNCVKGIMRKLGFEGKFLDMIWRCISTVPYSVLINGVPGQSFVPSRGVRQRDPLSPFLFVIMSEALSCLINLSQETNIISGLKICRRGSNITHLLFADDSMIFGKVKRQEIQVLKGIFEKYEAASGQKINKDKSSLLFSRNTPTEERVMASQILGINEAQWGRMYLGGMGFRDTKSFNLAMLAKQGWKLQLQVPTLAYKVLKERYFPTTDFLNAPIGSNPSYLWRSIRESQQLIRKGAIWRVGDGQSISVLNDVWIPYESPRLLSFPNQLIDEEMKVSELIDQRTMTWNDVKITEISPPYECELILSIPLSYKRPNDKQVAGSSSCNMMAFWKRIWHLELPRKVILFLWKTLNGILPTRQALIYRSIIFESNCPSCDNELETDFHCLCCCPLARAVWHFSKWGFTNIEVLFSSVQDWIFYIFQMLENEEISKIGCILWALWKVRNLKIFQGKSYEPLQVIELAGNLLEQYRLVKGVRSRRRILQINRTCEWRALVESKLNVDASIFELSSVRRMGAGFIVRNAIGEVELAGVRRMVMGQSVEEAELSALAWSFRCCQMENIMVKEIEMDCKVVVEWIKGRHLSGILGHIVEDCLNMMESINCVDILHCSREGNEVAHMIAKKAKEMREEAIAWFNISQMSEDFQQAIIKEAGSLVGGD